MSAMVLLVALAAPPVVDVQVDPAIDDAEQVRGWIEKEGAGVLQERGVEAKAVDRAWRIGVSIGGATYEYRVQLALERGGSPLADQPTPFDCECTNEQLIAKVETAIGDAIDALEAEPIAAPPIAKSVAPVEDPPRDDLQPQRKLGRLGIAGAVLIPIGAIALGTGIGLVVAGGSEAGDPSLEGDSDRLDYRPAGYAFLGVGAVALVTGIALLATDRARASRRSSSAHPLVSPTFAGLVFHSRF
jgi:hypothetical protein